MHPSAVRIINGERVLIATEDVDEGVVVAKLSGPIVPSVAVPASAFDRAVWLGDGRWLLPHSPGRYLGRVRRANCRTLDTLEVVTTQRVLCDQPLTLTAIDPATSPGPTLLCGVGSGLTVRPSPGRGRGVFADRCFTPGELIERCPVLVIPAPQWPSVAGSILSRYCFGFGTDSAVALGFGSLYNHSYRPNAYYLTEADDGVIDFLALRNIEPGEEITVNYNGTPEDQAPVWFEVVEER